MASTLPPISLFVSHAHEDRELAAALITLIQYAFVIPQDEIRCTSVSPYQLLGGDKITPTLKKELKRAECVIGLVTVESVKSPWVLFELGARWGQKDRGLLAVVGPHFDMKSLPGPIVDRIALRCDTREEVTRILKSVQQSLPRHKLDLAHCTTHVTALVDFVERLSRDQALDVKRREAARTTTTPSAAMAPTPIAPPIITGRFRVQFQWRVHEGPGYPAGRGGYLVVLVPDSDRDPHVKVRLRRLPHSQTLKLGAPPPGGPIKQPGGGQWDMEAGPLDIYRGEDLPIAKLSMTSKAHGAETAIEEFVVDIRVFPSNSAPQDFRAIVPSWTYDGSGPSLQIIDAIPAGIWRSRVTGAAYTCPNGTSVDVTAALNACIEAGHASIPAHQYNPALSRFGATEFDKCQTETKTMVITYRFGNGERLIKSPESSQLDLDQLRMGCPQLL